ncbi:nucleotidyltransferase domain-containing protein [Paenibacillus methanolicus]|uniref:Putative nucleotidyltransferase-like protein n=1 Tax=Paenibacillus methanolicus TaxID=582686 RepID=A0A5S5BPV0_9BACL|nr:nucleotidyltransferase family protein [Paenibacillus methanolicus]TYP69149.1 putative nucleotidyltransferase-like protein [Paenibacillus methanolicus]
MTPYQDEIIRMLNRSLHVDAETKPRVEQSADLEALLDAALQEGVGALLFPMLNKTYKESNQKNANWEHIKKKFVDQTLRNLLIMQQIKGVLGAFEHRRLQPLVLKGIAIGRLYPQPEYRPMADLDIFVRPEHWNEARTLLLELGYEQTEPDDYNVLHIEYQKDNSITIELHRNVMHTDYFGNRNHEEWYRRVWARQQQISFKQLSFSAMSPEDELIHQVLHFASHFVYHGTKLRHLFEMALIVKEHPDLDWNYIADILKLTGFHAFGRLLFSVIHAYFDVSIGRSMPALSRLETTSFMEDFLEQFSSEQSEGDFACWTRSAAQLRPDYNYKAKQASIWLNTAKVQYRTHHLKLPLILRNLLRNTATINKKCRVIRSYGLHVHQ